MVYHPVEELRGKYLPHLGIVDYETGGKSRSIAPGKNSITQPDQFAFGVSLETQLIVLASFMPSGIFVGPIQIQE